MELPGTWVNESETLIYRVIPKCACSTIGQAIFYGDNGRFFEGDIHDAKDGIMKWNQKHNQDRIRGVVRDGRAFTFTCVRNPFTRILSAFFDKICGIQRNGQRYRGDMVPMICKQYGVEVDGEFDQIASFRRFLLFVRDTIKFKKPMHPDIHWAPMAGHASTLVRNGGKYDFVFATEDFNSGLQHALAQAPLSHPVDVGAMPRFNESEGHGPKRAHPVEDYFSDLEIFIMNDIYKRDFAVFKYARQPGRDGPKKPLDVAEINEKLGRRP